MYQTVIRLLLSTLLLAVAALTAAGILWFRRAEQPNLAGQVVLAVCCVASLGAVWMLWSSPRIRRTS